MQHRGSKGFLKPTTQKQCPASSIPVGGRSAVSSTHPKSSNPLGQIQPHNQVQQLQHGEATKKHVRPKKKSLRALHDLKVRSTKAPSQQKERTVKKSKASVSRTNQNQDQAPLSKKQLETQKLQSKEKREDRSVVKRKTSADDLLRAEMVRIKTTICSEGYMCQKFAFKPKIKKSKQVCLRMVEEIDVKTGKKDYLLSWSKPSKAFSILSDLKSITRGFDTAPVLQRNQSALRDFTTAGKYALKLHCISFHFRDRSLDLVFQRGETAESLEKFVNFIRTHGGL